MTETAAVKVVVVGQGYVGLPLAMRAVEVGYDVVGYDVDDGRAKRLSAGQSFVEDISSEALQRGHRLWALPGIQRGPGMPGLRRGRDHGPHPA